MGNRKLYSLATFAGAVLAVALAAGIGFGIGILLGGFGEKGQ